MHIESDTFERHIRACLIKMFAASSVMGLKSLALHGTHFLIDKSGTNKQKTTVINYKD